MSQPAPSLIEQAAAQLAGAPVFSFFSTVEGIEDAAAGSICREFTGERLHRDRPEAYQAIVQAYANGLSIRQIARALRVSTNTVAAVVEREPNAVETHKQRTISGLRRFVGATIERMLEDLDRMPLQSLPVALGVAVDKLQLLSGEATQRVERVEVRADQVRSFIDSLPVIEGEVIEACGTGVSGETNGQRDSVLGLPSLPADRARADLQSGVSSASVSVEGESRTTLRTTCPADDDAGRDPSPELKGGGGGGRCVGAGVPMMIDPAAQNFGQGGLPPAESDRRGMGPASAEPPAVQTLCKPKKKPGASRAPRRKKEGGA